LTLEITFNFSNWWWTSIERIVPESDCITKLCVVASPAWKRVLATGSEGVNTLRQIGKDARGLAQALKGKLSGKISERLSHKDNEGEK